MKHKLIPAVIITLIAVCLLCGTAAAAITGSGTSSDPYVIHDKNDLRLLSGDGYAAYTAAGYFALDADITFTDSDAAFIPIGNNAHKFIGNFDGRNHKITKLKITGDPIGLFAYVSSGASISNIEFHEAQITGTGNTGTGVLYGVGYQAGTKVIVSNVKVYDSKITSSGTSVGGVAGLGSDTFSQVEFTSCLVSGCVITSSSGTLVGGVAGFGASTNSQLKFTSCNVEDCVMSAVSSGVIGGVSGFAASSSCQVNFESCHVKNCYLFANSPSSTNEGWCGGIAGCYYYYCTGSITGCTVEKCTIRSAWKYAGGILGGARENAVTISNCAVSDSTIIAANSYGAGVCPEW